MAKWSPVCAAGGEACPGRAVDCCSGWALPLLLTLLLADMAMLLVVCVCVCVLPLCVGSSSSGLGLGQTKCVRVFPCVSQMLAFVFLFWSLQQPRECIPVQSHNFSGLCWHSQNIHTTEGRAFKIPENISYLSGQPLTFIFPEISAVGIDQ